MTARRARVVDSRSTSAWRSQRPARVLVACAVVVGGSGAALGACVRHADIRDEPDGSVVNVGPALDAGDIPALDSGLATDAYPSCGERPYGQCVGPADFPCEFGSWVTRTAVHCQEATSCQTNGWLEVAMGSDGCVSGMGMDQPNDPMVACLLAAFGSVRCPCSDEQFKYFFGLGNTGACPDAGPPG